MTPLLLFALLAAPAAPPAPADPDDRCGRGEWIHHYLEIRPTLARQGSTITLHPMQARGPAMPAEPLDCTSDWQVSDPALARISDDRKSLTIAADARPGAELVISYLGGGKPVRRSVRIVGKDEKVLTGIRRQRTLESCDLASKVGEIEFTENGKFSVTFQPFETYRDYWGSYEFDPATGAVAMKAEGGNYQPPGLDLEGMARFAEDGALVLEDVYLGLQGGMLPPPQVATSCRYIFG
ncbi:MAG TPA: hypothetical protein VIT45_06875 [Allosphingosinicella sp.]